MSMDNNGLDLDESLDAKNNSTNEDCEDISDTDIKTTEEKIEDLVFAEEHYKKDYLEFIEKLFPNKTERLSAYKHSKKLSGLYTKSD